MMVCAGCFMRGCANGVALVSSLDFKGATVHFGRQQWFVLSLAYLSQKQTAVLVLGWIHIYSLISVGECLIHNKLFQSDLLICYKIEKASTYLKL